MEPVVIPLEVEGKAPPTPLARAWGVSVLQRTLQDSLTSSGAYGGRIVTGSSVGTTIWGVAANHWSILLSLLTIASVLGMDPTLATREGGGKWAGGPRRLCLAVQFQW